MEYNNIQEFCYAMWADLAAILESSSDIQTSNVRVADAANNQTSKSNRHIVKLSQMLSYSTYVYAFVPVIYRFYRSV